MTTKPKAKKFRIRRSDVAAPQSATGYGAAQGALAAAPRVHHAPDDAMQATARRPGAASRPAQSSEQELDAIRSEGLTGRQLRMARRIAQKHGLDAASDFDAVRQLRRQGVDPFQRANMLELVRNEAAGGDAAPARIQLPRKMAEESDGLPARRSAAPAESRIREVREIQRDIARRRRRSLAMMLLRLAAFVLLPTAFAGYYYFTVATPMYATESSFQIQQADSQASGGLGGMLSGTGLATQKDSTTVQDYLESREAMLRLDEDHGFRAHFSQDFIDPIRKLPAESTNEEVYKLYKKAVRIGYDPTEGNIRMEVLAADPATSAAFANALISYAEERVDGMTTRLRDDQMEGARESYNNAEARVEEAQQRVLTLQERLGVLDPASETSALMSQIATFETQLREKRLQLQQLLDNSRPSQARVDGVEGDIRRLENLVKELRASMTESGSAGDSLARVSAELRIAEADLANRQLLLQQALQQLETARIEANRQVRYLSVGVSAVAPDEATYPRAFENTALALLIFGGIYLMVSLTVSILREQVSA